MNMAVQNGSKYTFAAWIHWESNRTTNMLLVVGVICDQNCSVSLVMVAIMNWSVSRAGTWADSSSSEAGDGWGAWNTA
jgi:hypothetical protein